MNAILRTRCGCERQIQVPDPIPDTYKVALARHASFEQYDPMDLPTHIDFQVRVFELDDILRSRRKGPTHDVAVYVERL